MEQTTFHRSTIGSMRATAVVNNLPLSGDEQLEKIVVTVGNINADLSLASFLDLCAATDKLRRFLIDRGLTQ